MRKPRHSSALVTFFASLLLCANSAIAGALTPGKGPEATETTATSGSAELSIYDKYADLLGPGFEEEVQRVQRKQALALDRTRKLLSAGVQAVQSAHHHIDLQRTELDQNSRSIAKNQ